ncbi:MAG: translation initiation factor IF-6 [Halobacteriota archaeon]
MPNLLRINGNPLIGLYIRVTDYISILGVNNRRAKELLKDKLDTEVVVTTIAGSELVGALLAANSNGAVVSHRILSREKKKLKKFLDLTVLETNMTCFGNILCVNDNGGIVHPEADKGMISKVEKALDIDIEPGVIGSTKTVGMAACVTQKGGLVNPNSSEREIKKIEEILQVEVEPGTVNYGGDMVGTGLVANSKGYIAGEDTTGFELGVVEGALGFHEVIL